MIDIHSHILPGLDDGPAAIEQSLAMLADASAAGSTDIVATPHCNAEFPYDPALVERTMAELAAQSGGAPKIHRGCEFKLSYDNVDQLLRQPRDYTINSHQYLLLECPDTQIGVYTDGVLRRLLDAGLAPMIAHPERHPVLQRNTDRIERWVDLGCLVQVTAMSITGGFGNQAKAAAKRLLDRGLVHVVASDAHDPSYRPARLDQAYAAVVSSYGEDAAEVLFIDNPAGIIRGLPVSGGRQTLASEAKQRRWWPF